MKKIVLMVLLGLNAVVQLGGGTMMSIAPDKAARDVFAVPANPATAQLLGVIGGATLSYVLLTCVTMVWVAKRGRTGTDLAIVQGAMLTLVGIVMIATGTAAGKIDVAKGVAIAACAWWAREAGAA